jgi:CubicO group peptidase (beta-lactamase class C family)
LPGIAAAVAYQSKSVFAEGFGERSAGSGQLVDTDTEFQMARLSEAVGATAISRLVDEGVISWDDSIRHFLPGFALNTPYVSRNVTIADMYSHRSGLPGYAGDDLEDLGFSRSTIMDRLRYLPLSPFRNTYDYTNFGLTAGAQAAANGAGMSWAALNNDKLFTPAKMHSSSFRFAEYQQAANRAPQKDAP